MNNFFTLNVGIEENIQGGNPDTKPGFPADALALQIGNHTALAHAFLGRHAFEAMALARVHALATVFSRFAVCVALAGMDAIAMHFVTSAHCGTRASSGAVSGNSGRH